MSVGFINELYDCEIYCWLFQEKEALRAFYMGNIDQTWMWEVVNNFVLYNSHYNYYYPFHYIMNKLEEITISLFNAFFYVNHIWLYLFTTTNLIFFKKSVENEVGIVKLMGRYSGKYPTRHGYILLIHLISELTNVGKKQDALQALHDLITSKRYRVWQKNTRKHYVQVHRALCGHEEGYIFYR